MSGLLCNGKEISSTSEVVAAIAHDNNSFGFDCGEFWVFVERV